MKPHSIILLFALASPNMFAQSGANRADVSWTSFDTEHFTIVYHDGLAHHATDVAVVAEAIYPVVTTNLRTVLPGRTTIYISDLENVANAYAFADDHIYIWMRGLLDDGAVGGLRASGSSKWLRAVVTHEFTHTVIARATRSWTDIFMPTGNVPRWFNEGTARFMEPDRWTPDVDMVLRVAAVNGRTSYSEFNSRLDGALLYEGGHSLVRYMTWRFGDTVLARIVTGGRSGLGRYDFEESVLQSTGISMSDIYGDWLRTITVYYGTDYGVREETSEIGTPLVKSFSYVSGYRYSPDGRWVAMLAGGNAGPLRLHVAGSTPDGSADSSRPLRLVSDELGIDSWFGWSPDSRRIVLSKLRRGSHSAGVNDLYVVDVDARTMTRLTDDANLYDPSWRPDGSVVAAVQRRVGRDRIVVVDPVDGGLRTIFDPGGDVQMSNLAWSPDGTHLAFSLFDSTGRRVVAVLGVEDGSLESYSDGESTSRYPAWSPDSRRIAFTTLGGGRLNVAVVDRATGAITRVTDVAGGIYTVGWLPNSDSIVALSLDTRDKLVPYLVPAARTVIVTRGPTSREKYAGWTKASLPLLVDPAGALPPVAKGAENAYRSLAHLSPQLVAPGYGTDRSRHGARGYRIGLGALLLEPIGLQQLIAYADYGFTSREPGATILYNNNTLPFSIMGEAHRTASFARELAGIPYHELSVGGALKLSMNITPPNSLTLLHSIGVRAGWRRVEALNSEEFTRATIAPVRSAIAELGVVYTLTSPALFVMAEYRRSEPGVGSDLRFNRIEGVVSWRWRPFGEKTPALAVDAGSTLQWGDVLPQEFVGLDAHDDFAGGIDLFSQVRNGLVGQRGPLRHRVRGVRRIELGDRVVVATAGIEFAGGPNDGRLLLFADAGSAWFSDSTRLGSLRPTKGYGLEIRTSIIDGLVLSAGIAFEMIDSPRRDFYLRFSRGL